MTVRFRDTALSLTDKQIELVISHSDQDHTGGQEFFWHTRVVAEKLLSGELEQQFFVGQMVAPKSLWFKGRFSFVDYYI
jgi:metal-dependent hydrolase (beta-lactamase superfamily II)